MCGATSNKQPGTSGKEDTDWLPWTPETASCAGTCQDGNGGTTSKSGFDPEKEGIKVNTGYANDDCDNQCSNACAFCADSCGGTSCINSCKGQCDSCGGCGGCGGLCSTSCSGCQGGCDGGCEGNCQGQCNAGCKGEEMEEGLGLKIERIINVSNIKKIFEFVVYLVNMRTENDININEHFVKIDEWLEKIKDLDISNVDMTASLLYYTMPRVFENAFKEVSKSPSIQSGWLDKNKNYSPTIDIDVDNFKYYADKISAQEWLNIAFDLYDDVVGIYDGD